MNERLQKWLENHLVRSEYTEFGWQECHRYEFDEHELEKFAELIVMECGVALSPMLRDMVSRGQAYTLIKEHFGVEE